MAPVRTRYVALVSSRVPKSSKRKRPGGGSSGPTLTDITVTPTTTILEGAAPGTVVGDIVSVPPGAELELIDDAGGRFAIVGGQLVAGAVATDYEDATQHIIYVRATLGAASFERSIIISVVNVVELTGVNLSGTLSILENSVAGTVVGALSSVPSGATLSLTNNAGNRFALSGANIVAGAVTTNYEDATSHEITVHAELDGESLDVDFTIQVIDVDEISDISLTANSIPEGSAQATVVGTFSSTPAGATFTLLDNAGGRFQLSGAILQAGAVATVYDTDTSHQITVRGTRLGETYDETFTINVTNVNSISNITLSANSIAENSTAGTLVGALASVPPGATLSLTNTSSNRFALSGNNLVAGTTATNYEGATSHDITVQAQVGSDIITRNFTINVTDQDEINDISLTANVIAENSAQGTVVGTLSSTPAGATFTLVDDSSGRFQIVGTSLQAGATATNYETGQTHNITVRGTRQGETYDEVITINVTDVDEISAINLTNQTLAENSAAGTVVGILSSTPTGATWSLTDTAGNRFALSGNNLVAGATNSDREASTTYNVTVRGTRLSETFDQVFTITITDVDEISDITLSANSIQENSAAGVVVGALASVPAGATWSLTDTAGNRFALSGNNLVAGAVATDYDTATTHNVTVRGTRLGETYDEVFAIGVTNVNELTDIALTAQLLAENAAQGTTIGTLSSTPPGATFTLTDNGTNRAQITGTTLQAGSAAANYEAGTTFNVTVRATLGQDIRDEVFTITISDVDEVNDIILSANSIPENSAPGTVVGALSSNPAGATFALAPGNTAGTLFAVSGNNLVAGATATNYESATSHGVMIRATRLGETYDETLTVNVTNANELTDIALSAATFQENAAQGASIGTLSSTPGGATFTLLDSSSSRVQISGTSLQVGSTVSDFEVTPTFDITVRGTLGSDTRDEVFTITVTDEDELQALMLSGNEVDETVAANGTYVGTLSSTGPGAGFTLLDSAGGRFQLSGADVQTTGPVSLVDNQEYEIDVRGTKGSEIVDETFDILIKHPTRACRQTLFLSAESVRGDRAENFPLAYAFFVPMSYAEFTNRASAVYVLTNDAGGRFKITTGGELQQGPTPNTVGVSQQITIQMTLGAVVRTWTTTVLTHTTGAYALGNGGFGGVSGAGTTTGVIGGGSSLDTYTRTMEGYQFVVNSPGNYQTSFSLQGGAPVGFYSSIITRQGTQNGTGILSTRDYYLVYIDKTS